MTTATALLLTALAASAQSQGQAEGGVAVTNSPPPPVHARPPPVPATAPSATMPVLVAPSQGLRPLQSLISPADYPASALANREQGRVEFRLDIGPSGRVHACTITRSSGSAALDSATCRILRSRARYTPARDSNGRPGGYSVEDGVEWRLPAEDGERG